MGKPARKLSLTDYAVSTKSELVRCFVCSIPEAKEMNAARLEGENRGLLGYAVRQRGVSVPIMVRWLIDRGYKDVTVAKVKAHFDRHHHRRDG